MATRKLSSLYNGFVAGKSAPIRLGPNNPAIDNSSAQKDATAILRAQMTKGIVSHPKVDGPARPVKRQPGRRVSGATRISGGTL